MTLDDNKDVLCFICREPIKSVSDMDFIRYAGAIHRLCDLTTSDFGHAGNFEPTFLPCTYERVLEFRDDHSKVKEA